jgi:hypothetical protein
VFVVEMLDTMDIQDVWKNHEIREEVMVMEEEREQKLNY